MDTPAPGVAQTPPVDAATAFINTHTVVDPDVPLLDECPICLDNFSTEPCLRIIGIEGCTHHVGRACLQDMLRNHPNEEKRCPLCRTVWIAASAPPARRSVSRTYTYRQLEPGMLQNLVGIGENVAGLFTQMANSGPTSNSAVGNPQDMRPFATRNQRNTTTQSPILGDSASNSDSEDYETQLENFEQFTRDIQNIRTRARNTQLSRSRRRRPQESRHRQHAASIAANQTPVPGSDSGNAAAGSNSSGGAGTFHFLNRTLNPFRPINTINDVITPTTSMTAVRNRDHDGNRPPTRTSPLPPQDRAQTFASQLLAPNTVNADPALELLRIQQNTRHIERMTQLDHRDIELTRRETRLIKREDDLLDRERELRAREDRARELVATVRAQRDAMETLLRRQREEIDRALR